jgi:hypothetical protein
MYRALRRAGFPTDICLSMIQDKECYPSWILPAKPMEKIGDIDYDEDDD